jgi:hypothetical protein
MSGTIRGMLSQNKTNYKHVLGLGQIFITFVQINTPFFAFHLFHRASSLSNFRSTFDLWTCLLLPNGPLWLAAGGDSALPRLIQPPHSGAHRPL